MEPGGRNFGYGALEAWLTSWPFGSCFDFPATLRWAPSPPHTSPRCSKHHHRPKNNGAKQPWTETMNQCKSFPLYIDFLRLFCHSKRKLTQDCSWNTSEKQAKSLSANFLIICTPSAETKPGETKQERPSSSSIVS
jgi:hypothetical protein